MNSQTITERDGENPLETPMDSAPEYIKQNKHIPRNEKLQ